MRGNAIAIAGAVALGLLGLASPTPADFPADLYIQFDKNATCSSGNPADCDCNNECSCIGGLCKYNTTKFNNLGAGLQQTHAALGPNLVNIKTLFSCLVIDGVTDSLDVIDWFSAPTQATLVSAWCSCEGDCEAPTAQFTFTDRAGNAISLTGGSPLSCNAGSGVDTPVTFDTSDADRVLAAYEGIRFSVPNTPLTADRIMLCVRFSVL